MEAEFYHKLGPDLVECDLCPRVCRLAPGQDGFCRSRGNRLGQMQVLNFALTAALHIDPVEKKPLYHFHPGQDAVSLGANSCNLNCLYCQNHSISRQNAPTQKLEPADLLRLCRTHHVGMVAFTYTEPITWFEYIMEAATFLRQHHIKIVLVTNGYANPEPWAKLLSVTDALKIDLKAADPEFYRDLCAGELEPVLNNIKAAVQAGVHTEITNLVIPGYNDAPAQIKALVTQLADIDRFMPLHITRFYPQYLLDAPVTSFLTLTQVYEQARNQLHYVYIGNVESEKHSHTWCHSCGRQLIARNDYKITVTGLREGKCRHCGAVIPGVWD